MSLLQKYHAWAHRRLSPPYSSRNVGSTFYFPLSLQPIAMPAPEPAFARRWRTKFNAALHRTTAKPANSTSTGYYFPLAQYLSLHLVLSIFLAFSLGFLPRSQAWLDSVLPESWSIGKATAGVKQVISADRPEHEFLTPLTANGTITLAWTCAGLVVCMTWWGAHLRRWWTAFRDSEGGMVKQDDTLLVCLCVS
jgi:hypothetical protein